MTEPTTPTGKAMLRGPVAVWYDDPAAPDGLGTGWRLTDESLILAIEAEAREQKRERLYRALVGLKTHRHDPNGPMFIRVEDVEALLAEPQE